jgi:hypothetical protein
VAGSAVAEQVGVFCFYTKAMLMKNMDIVIGYDSGGERR